MFIITVNRTKRQILLDFLLSRCKKRGNIDAKSEDVPYLFPYAPFLVCVTAVRRYISSLSNI